MSSDQETNRKTVTLRFGTSERFTCALEAEQLLAFRSAPAALPDFSEALSRALSASLEFPPMRRSAFPGDRVVLAVDRNVPETEQLIAGIWKEMEAAGVEPEDLLILQPAPRDDRPPADPRAGLSDDVRARITWRIHDASDEDACGYLASSASGERLYLAREIVEADVVISVGRIGYNSVLGYCGTNSVFYPGLSNAEAVQKAFGQGHTELRPDDERPLRQVIDEIGWLMGTQYSVQVLPSVGGGVSAVLAGATDAVFRKGKSLLSDQWMVNLEERSDTVAVAVDGSAGWEQIGAALETARNIVTRDGKILILSDLSAEIGEGLQLVRDSFEPDDVMPALRAASPLDFFAATQLVSAAGWADIYLLSNLDGDLVEELFMTPVGNEREARRLLQASATCVLLESAQFFAACVGSA